MSKLFLTFLASLIFMTLSACSDHSHGNGSHSHDEQEHHETTQFQVTTAICKLCCK